MKRYVSVLSVLACILCVNNVRASECIGEDCDIIEHIDITKYTEDDTLQPVAPQEDIWVEDEFVNYGDETCEVIDENFINVDYNCPFETDQECIIWAKKPIYGTNVLPRNPHLNSVKLDGILIALTFDGDISANDEMAKPLLNRYLALMRTSRACCNEGIIYRLRKEKTDDEDIYRFLQDDANKYALGARCMVMDDQDIGDSYSYGVSGEMVKDVRNSCLCKNRKWVDSLLEPFFDLYQLAPDFEYMPFYYTYMDGLQREITVSVNQDVQKVMELLQYCPD